MDTFYEEQKIDNRTYKQIVNIFRPFFLDSNKDIQDWWNAKRCLTAVINTNRTSEQILRRKWLKMQKVK